MHARITRGSYCHPKCNNENRYKTLQFETFQVSHTKTAHQNLSSLLAGTDLDLGPVDENWFGRSRLGRVKENKYSDKQQEKILATPLLSVSKDQPSPSLFSPEDPRSLPRRGRKGKTGGPWGNCQTTPIGFSLSTQDTSPATPGIAAFTPNQATGKVLDPSQPSQSQRSQAGTSGFSPFPTWNPTNKLDTPVFMKQLFKTPSSIVRTPGTKVVTADRYESTPQRLSISLGADLDDSNLSWTSSLATPPGSKSDNKMGTSDGIQSDGEMRIGVMPKALHFTEDEINPRTPKASINKGCDTRTKSFDDTQSLQLMRLSSLEEETTSEDTLDSDVICGGDGTNEDGEIVMGIPTSRHTSLLGKSENKQSDERIKSRKDRQKKKKILKYPSEMVAEDKKDNAPHLLESEGSTKPYGERHGTHTKNNTQILDNKTVIDVGSQECGMPTPMSYGQKSAVKCVKDVHIPSNKEMENLDNSDAASRRILPNKRVVSSSQDVCSNQILGRHEDTSEILGGDRLQAKPENSTSEEVAVCETKSLSNTMKPADNLSNIEETLAFFLATPPQRRIKLGKKSNAGAVKSEFIEENYQENYGEKSSIGGGDKNGLNEDENKSVLLQMSSSVKVQDNTGLSHNMSSQATNTIKPVKTEPQGADAIEGHLEPQHSTELEKVTKTTSKQKQYLPNKNSIKHCEISQLQESDGPKMVRTDSSLSVKAHMQLTPQKSNPPSTNTGSDANHNFIFNTTPNVSTDNQDFFSQISPNYADALCQAVDAVSSDHEKIGQEIEQVGEIKIEASPTQPVPVNVKAEPADDVLDQVQRRSQFGDSRASDERGNASQLSNKSNQKQTQQVTQPKQDTVSTVPVVLSLDDQNTSKTKSASIDNMQASRVDADTPDEATAIFRMQPRATKMFYYPSPGNSLSKQSPTDKKELCSSGTPKLLAGTLHVVKEEDETVNESDAEGQTTEASQASSTPANRSSGFVTFSSFVKSIEQDSKSTENTFKSSQNLKTSSPLCQPVTSNVVSNLRLTSNIKEGLSSSLPTQSCTNNQTTPVTGRSTAPLSLRSRRRLGRSNLPPPKRLRTSVEVEDFHQNLKVEEPHDVTDSSKLDEFKPGDVPAELVQSTRGKEQCDTPYPAGVNIRPNTSNAKISPSKSVAHTLPQPACFTSGFKTAANKYIGISKVSLQKAKGMMAEIYSQEIHFGSGNDGNELPKCAEGMSAVKALGGKNRRRSQGISTGFTHNNKDPPLYLNSKIDKTKPLQTVGFSSASGKAIKISAPAMEKAHRIIGEVQSECENLGILDAETKQNTVESDPLSSASKGSILSKRMDCKPSMSFVASAAHIPTNVGFSSAIGKAIPISAKVMEKAQTLMNAEDNDLVALSSNETVPTTTVGFSSASGKSICISSKAMKHARSLMKEIDHECDLPQQSTGSVSMSLPSSRTNNRKFIKDTKRNDSVESTLSKASSSFGGFQSASGKKINISEEALRKAKKLVEDDQQNLSEMIQSTSPSSAGVEKAVESQCTSPVKEPLPSIVQFSSASGKAIQISDASLQKAKCFMEQIKETNEGSIPSSVQFASASGQTIKISDGALEKARSFLSSVDSGISTGDSMPLVQLNLSDGTSNTSDESLHKVSDTSTLSSALTLGKCRQTPKTQPCLKQKKDYSKLPKGFRPFKPPARIITTNNAPVVKQISRSRINRPKVKDLPQLEGYKGQDHKEKLISHTLDEKVQITSKDNITNNILAENEEMEVEPPHNSTKMQAVLDAQDGFSDDGLSLSQTQHEIQAAENMELMYAFMQAEDESYTQDPDKVPGNPSAAEADKLQVKKMSLQGNRIQDSDAKFEPGEALVKVVLQGDADINFDDSLIKEEDLHLIAKVEANHRDDQARNTNTDLMNTSVVGSQGFQHDNSLNQGFVNSQNTVCSELDGGAVNKEKKLLYAGDDPLNVSESAKHVLAELQEMEQQLQLTSHDKEDCTGFQGADRMSQELVNKANQERSKCEHLRDSAKDEEKNLCDVNGKANIPSFSGSHTKSEIESSVFQTGSGKRMTVSTEALKKAKHMLAVVEEEAFDKGISGVCGFQTASGKKVSVSGESLEKARSLISESSMPDPNCQFSNGLKYAEGSIPSSSKLEVGFCTASGNKVHVSNTSLQIARNLLNEEDREEIRPVQRKTTVNDDQSVPSFAGFLTAAGSKVQISESSLQKARDLLTEETTSITQRYESLETSTTSISKQRGNIVGFQTASGNKVHVSEDALQRACQFLTEDNDIGEPESSRSPSTKGVGRLPSSIGNKQGFVGFQTASGNKVHVSEEALKQAHRFLAEGDLNNGKFDSAGDRPNSQNNQVSPLQCEGFVGFQTASGNKVSVSKESLQKAEKLLSKANATATGGTAKQDHQFVDKYPSSKTGCKFVGFQTASGSAVSVSNESLQKANKLLAEDDNDATKPSQSSKPTFDGFQTASGNKVKISEDSLKKAQDFLNQDNCLLQESGNNQPARNQPKKSFVGFTTASGSAVVVSEESLKVAKSLLMDDEPEQDKLPLGVVPQDQMQKQPVICRRFEPDSGMVDTGAARDSSFSPQNNSRNRISNGDRVVPQQNTSQEKNGTGAGTNGKETVKRIATQPMLSCTENESKKQFVPYRRQQPVSSSPAGQWGDRSNIVSHSHSKSFIPYRTTPVVKNNPCRVPSHQRQTPQIVRTSSHAVSSSLHPTRRIPSQVHTEQIQVVPQQPLQSNQWTPNGTPFYKKANFQQGLEQQNRGNAHVQKSFQKFVPNGGLVKNHSSYNNSKNSTNSVLDTCPATESGDVQTQPDLKEVWKQARMKQLARIEAKKKQHIKPHPGSLFSKRQQMPRIKLYEVVDGQAPQTYSQQQLFTYGLLPDTLHVNVANADSFKFKGQEHFSQVAMATQDGILLGDGGRLILDGTGETGKEEFYHAFLDTAGVDPKLVSCEWVYNHYRWIVWKLAAMEVAYPQQFATRLLTPHWVLLQLKYRYDREIDHSQRSALKKILERDDTPSRRLVLCVSAIHRTSTESAVSQMGDDKCKNDKQKSSLPTIELTDGWYCIRTVIDKPLSAMVQNGKIFVGQKLCIYGADLVGSDDACSPLEVPANLMLRISANSTRPARYDARLGLQANPQPFPVSMSSLYGEGGMIGCLDVVVVRCYPVQYMEKHGDSGATFRNSRAEEKEARKYSREKQQRMEKLFSKMQKEFEKKQAKKEPRRKTRSRSSQRLKEEQIQNLNTGQEIYDALNEAYDPGSIEMHLTERQMSALHNYQRSLQEKEQADLQAEFKKVLEEQEEESKDRVVTPLLKVRLADYHQTRNSDPNQTCMMAVWRPTEDIMAYLMEGKRLRLYNVNVSPGRFPQGGNSVQLTSTKRTRYKELSSDGDKLGVVYQPRIPTPMWQLKQNGYEPLYGEVDVVGLVVSVAGGSSLKNSTSSLQTVYIADADSNMIAIKFWGGLEVYCLEDMIKPCHYICCGNLQYKSSDRFNATPYLQASDASSFTQTPKSGSMRQVLSALKTCIKNPQEFIRHIEEGTDTHSVSTIHMMPPPIGTPTPDMHSRVSPSVIAKSVFSGGLTVGNQEYLQAPGTTPISTVRCHVTFDVPDELASEQSSTEMSKLSNQSVPDGNVSSESKSITSVGKSKPLSDITPTSKRFIPFVGDKSCPGTSKRFTPATKSKSSQQGSTVQHNSTVGYAKGLLSSNASIGSTQKHITPVIPQNKANRNQVPSTPVGGYQGGSGKLFRQTRSNLFGTANKTEFHNSQNTNSSGNKTTSSTPGRFQSCEQNVTLDSMPDLSSQSSQLEKQKKDISRRTRLLQRIPSPPPLSPLPSPVLGKVRRGFRTPSRTPRGSSESYDMHATVTTKSDEMSKSAHYETIGSTSKHCHKLKDDQGMSKQEETGGSGKSMNKKPSKAAANVTPQAKVLQTVPQDNKTTPQNKSRSFGDGLTASQMEVQEVMRMSLSCLQELDMEWSQQTPVKECSHDNADQKAGSQCVYLENQPKVKVSAEKNLNQESESPPMDLDDSEMAVGFKQQETMTQVEAVGSLQSSEPVKSDKDVASQYSKGQNNTKANTSGKIDEPTSAVHAAANKTVLTEETKHDASFKEVSVKKETSLAGGRPRAVKRPASESSSTQHKPKQSKRFCTRADFAVMDFESLDLAGDMTNRRVTRSSSRKFNN